MRNEHPVLGEVASRRAHQAVVDIVELAALLVYLNALGNGFALDDVPIIRDNPRVHGFWSIGSLLLGPYWPNSGEHYRPLVLLSFAVD